MWSAAEGGEATVWVVSWIVGLLTMAPSRHCATLFSSVWNLFESIGWCHGLLGSSRWHHRVIAQHCSLRCGTSLKASGGVMDCWASSRWHHRVTAQHCSLRCGTSLKASGGVMDCWAPHDGTIASLHNTVLFGVEPL